MRGGLHITPRCQYGVEVNAGDMEIFEGKLRLVETRAMIWDGWKLSLMSYFADGYILRNGRLGRPRPTLTTCRGKGEPAILALGMVLYLLAYSLH